MVAKWRRPCQHYLHRPSFGTRRIAPPGRGGVDSSMEPKPEPSTRSRARSVSRWAIGLALLSASGPARSQSPENGDSEDPAFKKTAARLSYVRGAGAEQCAEESQLRQSVAEHMGYDPFVEQADHEVVVLLRKRESGLAATVEIRDGQGKLEGKRHLTSAGTGCEELSKAAALAVSIALDPLLQNAAEKPPDPAPSPVVPAPVARERPTTVAPSAPSRPAEPVRVALGGGLMASNGAAPSTSAGLLALARVHQGGWSLGLGGRVDFPAEATASRGGIRTQLVLGSLIPCLHYDALRACATVSFGALQGTATGVDETTTQTTFYAAAGARLGWGVALSQRLSLEPFAGADATLTPTTLSLNDREEWTSPPVAGSVGLLLLGIL